MDVMGEDEVAGIEVSDGLFEARKNGIWDGKKRGGNIRLRDEKEMKEVTSGREGMVDQGGLFTSEISLSVPLGFGGLRFCITQDGGVSGAARYCDR
ncbi:hypothetical protein L1987_44558 [Smallanthus sonchifolius]|uniref:Uncharacterized protein n=1 Tax=Smallanthus sonchifolius TaxID=185202 RepID=A0ACB9GQS9_9ASTR|nr:hypothetical protein L1987_44558 [Smallanthus sonchifolius]